MTDLEELERLAKAATPGPWDYDASGVFKWAGLLEKRHVCECMTGTNSAYIVAACNAVPELIARVRELEKMVDYLATEFSSGDDQSDCDHTHLACQYRNGYWCRAGLEGQKQCWIRIAEQAAKEAGE